MKLSCCFALFLAVLSITSIGCVNETDSNLIQRSNSLPETTPWNLEQLSKVPKFEWDEGNQVRSNVRRFSCYVVIPPKNIELNL